MPKIIAKKHDWITLGYKLFAEKGIEGIVIEKMAQKLKVNKSSFYWHFKTKKEFVDKIISYWIDTDTEQIIKLTESSKNGKEKFLKLVELAFKKEPHLDFIFFLKRYAKKNKQIQALIDNIDTQRIAYTKSLLIEMNFPSEEADIKSQLFYKYLIGYHEMIRYKKQPKNYIDKVKIELNQFIKF
ncbi:TetR/AcrR family transcriptional regulator [Tenacibaculum aiptasiae]|uniref:TetR/AcrR family transcriptional regulator n=1 Tax=Tenacibaculum aiptasiae TaxID=426481 RepID=UPI002330F699|nr:TetR/AcrR family transcriptional regulator [Tenacibaculum aiptasiae]